MELPIRSPSALRPLCQLRDRHSPHGEHDVSGATRSWDVCDQYLMENCSLCDHEAVLDRSLSLTMAFHQRLLLWAAVPLLVLLTLHVCAPGYLHLDLRHSLFNLLPARSNTPIIISAFTHWSHFEKIAKIAIVLAELGYPVIFVTGRMFEKDVTNLHPKITYYPLVGGEDKMTPEEYRIYESKTGLERELYIMKIALMGSMKPAHDTLQQVFRDFRTEHGTRAPLVSLFDTPVIGHHPILLGASGVKPDASIVVNCHPLTLNSNDSFPFYMGKVPYDGLDANAVHHQANQDQRNDHMTSTLSKWYWEALNELGASTDRYLMDSMHSVTDRILSLGVPEFEFPRSDVRPAIHYFGAFKGRERSAVKPADLPSWWTDVSDAKQQGKKVIAVSQGTVETDLSNLVLPTLKALKHKDNVLVIATTVAVDPSDVADLVVPQNARVAKFVPYDLLLPMVSHTPSCHLRL